MARSEADSRYALDTSKIRTELGLELRDAAQTVIDTMTSLEIWGHLGKKTKVGAAPSRQYGPPPQLNLPTPTCVNPTSMR